MSRFLNNVMLKVNTIDCRGSVCDGPGIRSVVFLQGCRKKCSGCHNPQTWDENGGKRMSVYDIFQKIDRYTPSKRITISGGEPLLQLDGLQALIDLLHERHYDIALYTGYDIKEVPKSILCKLDYIKYGRYKEDLHTTLEYYGSTNQKFIPLK